MSNSGRYEVRMHESDWVLKGSRSPATRKVIMVALQRVDQLLIRASDTMEATRARLDGITLDVGRPVATAAALRPAIGVEMCDCPPEFNSTSCQDPGRGYYR